MPDGAKIVDNRYVDSGRCKDGFHDVNGKCTPIGTAPAEGTSTDELPTLSPKDTRASTSESTADLKPKEKGVKEKVKDATQLVGDIIAGSTTAKIISEFGGSARKFFEGMIKTFSNITCPSGITDNVCQLIRITSKSFGKVFNGVATKYDEMIEKSKDKRFKRHAEVRLKGYDKATAEIVKAMRKRGVEGQAITPTDAYAIDTDLMERLGKISEQLGGTYDPETKLWTTGDALKNPKTAEQWTLRAEYEMIRTTILSVRNDMKGLNTRAYQQTGTPTARANVEQKLRSKDTKIKLPTSGKEKSIRNLHEARNL